MNKHADNIVSQITRVVAFRSSGCFLVCLIPIMEIDNKIEYLLRNSVEMKLK